MDLSILIVLIPILFVVFLFAGPSGEKSSKPPKKFGEGLLSDTDGANLWKPGDTGDN
jgi:hypothetical protein